MERGVRGREHIGAYFGRQVPIRRERGGSDLFSQLCRATTEDGALLSPEAVVDHMSFFMMAAHDTLTSSLSAFVMLLAGNPIWQESLRSEIAVLGLAPDEPLAFDRLADMKLTEMAFKETLRMVPPVPVVPRRVLREFSFKGITIPAGTSVGVNPLFTHHMPEYWPEPSRFNPARFAEAAPAGRSQAGSPPAGSPPAGRHRFAFVPYGGGAHMCLGLHFAYMQAKCFSRHFLPNIRVSLPQGGSKGWQMWPIPKPKDGLPLNFEPA